MSKKSVFNVATSPPPSRSNRPLAAEQSRSNQKPKNKTNRKTLKNLFLDELADMYDAERRIIKALPRMAKAATSPDLREAIQSHLRETEGQVRKLDQVFKSFGVNAKGKTCEATVGLLKEGDEIASQYKGSPALNAALIAATQKIEHYEMASYGCLHEWAGMLGNKEAAGLLEQILGEEKAANESLNGLAHSSSNQEALGESGAASRSDAKAAAPLSPGKIHSLGTQSSEAEKKNGTNANGGDSSTGAHPVGTGVGATGDHQRRRWLGRRSRPIGRRGYLARSGWGRNW
ncbi:MAG: ferritin-like domain-containing protein [Verrucomicrobiales bacterium]|nr:ferritin-like domain-containing protein [Verrucomicrobiales bacterium]